MRTWAWMMVAFGCGGSPTAEPPGAPLAAAGPHDGVDRLDPTACAPCHGAIVSEWQESMHAASHHTRDPVYRAMRTLRMEKQGEAVASQCAPCHTPLAPPDDHTSALAERGVACGACHMGPSLQADGRATCLECHAAQANPAGVPTCTTGSENEAAGSAPCASCHMPGSDGHPSHRFPGPHRAWYQGDPSFLAQGFTLSTARTGDTLTVTLGNTTGHGFPSGFPGRVASVRLTSGEWSATPDALVLRKVYLDASGAPTLPPFAASLGSDTRLTPGESRSVQVALPPGTGEVRAELVYSLLAGPAAAALGLADAPEGRPVVVGP